MSETTTPAPDVSRTWAYEFTATPGTWADMRTDSNTQVVIRPEWVKITIRQESRGGPIVHARLIRGHRVKKDGQLSLLMSESYGWPAPAWLDELEADCLSKATAEWEATQ